jgi:hypothetical protein
MRLAGRNGKKSSWTFARELIVSSFADSTKLLAAAAVGKYRELAGFYVAASS